MNKKKKGISLIVLVITIIVMIILAAAIVISLNNANVINSANKAVNDTNLKNIKSAVDMEYSDYLIKNPQNITNLSDYLTDRLISSGIITGNDYYIKVYDDQAYVIKVGSLADKYYKDELKIGDYVAYDSGANSLNSYECKGTNGSNNMTQNEVTISSSSSMKWKLLSVHGDKVSIISADLVKPDGRADGFGLYGAYSWLKGEEILNNACSVFGKGKYATKARSINVEDIDEITGYNKETYTMMFIDMWSELGNISYNTELKYDGKTKIFNKVLPILKHPDIQGENYLSVGPMTYKQNSYWYKAQVVMNESRN